LGPFLQLTLIALATLGRPSVLIYSNCFGDFKKVYGQNKIMSYYSTAVKNYCVTTEDADGKAKQTLKMKGFSLKNAANFKSVAGMDLTNLSTTNIFRIFIMLLQFKLLEKCSDLVLQTQVIMIQWLMLLF
jgi:hypothetical protein